MATKKLEEKRESKPLLVTWEKDDNDGKAVALAEYRVAHASDVFKNIAPNNISVRDAFSREDYDYFRPNERIPTGDMEIISACMQAYKRFSIIRNTIDLMSDFACKGIDLVHPSASQQKTYKKWFQKVNGKDRSERILSMLFRAGTSVVKRINAKLPSDSMKSFQADAAEQAIIKPKYNLKKNEIPWQYIVHDPRSLELIDGPISPLLGNKQFRYALRISESYKSKLLGNNYTSNLSGLPLNTFQAIRNKDNLTPLDPNNTIPIFYRKDDFEVWATPMLYPLLEDLSLYIKLRMADRAALDSAINYVRLWNLGDIDNRIFPTEEAVSKLASMLLQGSGGGGMDLIWGPELSFQETSTELHNFLGASKYESVLEAIYQGLGIPPSLSGSSSSEGYTNNFVSLKTLIERLEYGRSLIVNFWNDEIALVQNAFGFREPATVVFDSPTLSDDSAQKQLLLEMWDRGLISDENIQSINGIIPEIERIRVLREDKQRKDGKRPEKINQFIPSDKSIEATKDLAKENAKNKMLGKTAQNSQNTGQRNGRPKAAVDKVKRKEKKVKPRSGSVKAVVWANETLEKINKVVLDPYLKIVGKANARQFTDEESAQFENYKFDLLCSLPPLVKASNEDIESVITGKLTPNADAWKLYKKVVAEESGDLTLGEDRQLRAASYAMCLVDGVINNEE